jgi:hypothetical protein
MVPAQLRGASRCGRGHGSQREEGREGRFGIELRHVDVSRLMSGVDVHCARHRWGSLKRTFCRSCPEFESLAPIWRAPGSRACFNGSELRISPHVNTDV